MSTRSMFRGLAALLLTGLAVSCGGGDAPPVVAVYGDSLSSGHIATAPYRLAVPPVRRLEELATGRFVAIDFSQPGATIHAALTGGDTMPIGPFAQHVKTVPAQIVLLRWGGADALLGVPVDVFSENLRELVRLTFAADRVPVLVGLFQSKSHAAAALQFNPLVKAVATELGVLFIPLDDISCGEADGIHPDQACADAHAARMVQYLVPIADEVKKGKP